MVKLATIKTYISSKKVCDKLMKHKYQKWIDAYVANRNKCEVTGKDWSCGAFLALTTLKEWSNKSETASLLSFSLCLLRRAFGSFNQFILSSPKKENMYEGGRGWNSYPLH